MSSEGDEVVDRVLRGLNDEGRLAVAERLVKSLWPMVCAEWNKARRANPKTDDFLLLIGLSDCSIVVGPREALVEELSLHCFEHLLQPAGTSQPQMPNSECAWAVICFPDNRGATMRVVRAPKGIGQA